MQNNLYFNTHKTPFKNACHQYYEDALKKAQQIEIDDDVANVLINID